MPIAIVVENLKHRTILYTIYGCGLRISELINLKMSDIDREYMCLWIINVIRLARQF